MRHPNRRRFLKLISVSALFLCGLPLIAGADPCRAVHPLVPPDASCSGQCPVCGMARPMWARTWVTFDAVENVSQVCSFHCLADWVSKSGGTPTNVRLAVYHDPRRTVPADRAFIVVGSAAAGTMSPVSKVVFAERSGAEAFAADCGGEVVDFETALRAAQGGLAEENRMIHARRLKKGKIVEPTENDRCLVCGMFPARYPYGKCQMRTRDGRTLHFCSTQCLFAFIGNGALYVDRPAAPLFTWVIDRNSGMWISGLAAFYVVGSSTAFGPMGFEAFPFNSLEEARGFAAENGGRTAGFADVTIEKIVPGWRYPEK